MNRRVGLFVLTVLMCGCTSSSPPPVQSPPASQPAAVSRPIVVYPNYVVAYWRFKGEPETVASSQAIQEKVNEVAGKPVGEPVYVNVTTADGDIVTGLLFDGRDDAIIIEDNPLLAVEGSLTLEAYVVALSKPKEKLGQPRMPHYNILWYGDDRSGVDPYRLACRPDGRLEFIVTDRNEQSATLISPKPLPEGELLHVAGTLDVETGEQKLFINGQEVASQVTKVQPAGVLDPDQSPTLAIGDFSNVAHPRFKEKFHGVIVAVRISSEALSPRKFLPVPSSEDK